MTRKRRDYATEIPAHLTAVAPPGLDANKAWLLDQAYRAMQAADAAGDYETFEHAETRVNELLDRWHEGHDCE